MLKLKSYHRIKNVIILDLFYEFFEQKPCVSTYLYPRRMKSVSELLNL